MHEYPQSNNIGPRSSKEPRGSYYAESGDYMADEKQRILADHDLRPAYYDDFHCLAEDCKLSCCKGWSITFEKKDYLSLKRQKGSDELNRCLDGGLRRIKKGPRAELFYGEFNMDTGICPLLREDGLCRLQIEKGHSALPFVCRSYPRGSSYQTSGYLERSLSPSCEGVLKLLWELPDGIEFRSDPLPREQHKWANIPEGNYLAKWFPVVREWCIDTLQDRRFTLPQRIFLMGMALKALDEVKDDIEPWLQRSAALSSSIDIAGILPTGDAELAMYLSDCLRTLMLIQVSDPNLLPIKGQVLEGMELTVNIDRHDLTIPLAPYCEARERFQENFSDYDYFMENLMVSVFFHLNMPNVNSPDKLWKSYVNFCNLYAIYRFLSVMSCWEDVPGDRDELFRLIVFASRSLIHNSQRQHELRDELFQNDSATLAHMAILLCG